jgi:hypothetical protein
MRPLRIAPTDAETAPPSKLNRKPDDEEDSERPACYGNGSGDSRCSLSLSAGKEERGNSSSEEERFGIQYDEEHRRRKTEP